MNTEKTISHQDIQRAIQSMAEDIAKQHANADKLIIAGIADGGVVFGQKLTKAVSEVLGQPVENGQVNITYHRDDIALNPIPAVKGRTKLPLELEDATVILADDVLFSCRTARAAINEVFDQGRPDIVKLAILFDRGNHKLPIIADYVGFAEKTNESQRVKVKLDNTTEGNDRIQILTL